MLLPTNSKKGNEKIKWELNCIHLNILTMILAISHITDLRIRAVPSELPLLLTFELCLFILYSVFPQRHLEIFPDCMFCVHAL